MPSEIQHYQVEIKCLIYIISANHADSTFDVALCGVVAPATNNSESLLAEVLRILKPCGKLILVESAPTGEVQRVLAKLKLTGYIDVTQVRQSC